MRMLLYAEERGAYRNALEMGAMVAHLFAIANDSFSSYQENRSSLYSSKVYVFARNELILNKMAKTKF